MRDEHRPKRDLLSEVVGLRKQVADLKEAAVVRWRAEEAVRRSEQEYRVLVEHAPGGLCRLGADGAFEQVNITFSELLGYETRSETLEFAKVVDFFLEKGVREKLLETLRATCELHAVPVVLRHRDDSAVPVLISGRTVPSPGKAIDGYVLLVTTRARCHWSNAAQPVVPSHRPDEHSPSR